MCNHRSFRARAGIGCLFVMLIVAGGCVRPAELLSPCAKLYNPFMRCHCIEKHAELHTPDPCCYGYCPPVWRPWPCPEQDLYGGPFLLETEQGPSGGPLPAVESGEPTLAPEPDSRNQGPADNQVPIPAPADQPQDWGPAPIPEEPAEPPAPMPMGAAPGSPGEQPFAP